MAVAITIGGVDKTGSVLVQGCSIEQRLGGRDTLRLSVIDKSASPTYRPAMLAEITVAEGGTLFGGVITGVSETPILEPQRGILSRLSAVDYSLYASRVIVNEVYAADRADKSIKAIISHAIDLLCEPVQTPAGELEYIHYFCGNTEIPSDLKDHEPQRVALYKATVSLIRAFANIADELEPAGYSEQDVARIKRKMDHYLTVRDIVRRASGEILDLKPYEADMRHLIDTYIEADEPRKISPFDDIGLIDLIVKTGIADAIAAQLGGLKGNRTAIAETIENNVRSVIIRDRLTDPAYYDKMSTLLDEIIAARKAKAIEYEEYLKKMGELAKDVKKGHSDETPTQLDTPGKRAIYNNLRNPAPDDVKTGDEVGVLLPTQQHKPYKKGVWKHDKI